MIPANVAGNGLEPVSDSLILGSVDRSFDPDVIREMSDALELACDTLRLRRVDDPATRLVAEKIIELALRGVRGAGALHAAAINEFKSAEKGLIASGISIMYLVAALRPLLKK